jgi:hypothetical protein
LATDPAGVASIPAPTAEVPPLPPPSSGGPVSYWVSYSIIKGGGTGLDILDDGECLGLASCVVTRSSAPRTELDVLQLGDDITEMQRGRGRIPADAHAGILAWSLLGGAPAGTFPTRLEWRTP